MLPRGRALQLEPPRIVVELRADEFWRFDRACTRARVAPADALRLAALWLADAEPGCKVMVQRTAQPLS